MFVKKHKSNELQVYLVVRTSTKAKAGVPSFGGLETCKNKLSVFAMLSRHKT